MGSAALLARLPQIVLDAEAGRFRFTLSRPFCLLCLCPHLD